MSTITSTLPSTAVSAPPAIVATRRADVVVDDKITIPGWIDCLEAYRRWAESDEYPQSGWVSFLDGTIWVDPNMEELFTHNQVKGAVAYAIMSVLGPTPNGMFVHDRMLLTNAGANLSTEPDGLFFLWTTAQANRLQIVESADGFIALSGTPDMVLEVVSKHSVSKDTIKLRQLYWTAGISEYWLVDARGSEPRFEILRRMDQEYIAVEAVDGWLASATFQQQFQIVKHLNPLGQPQFVVNHQ
jgi:Uma2 family endonuclease